MFVRTYMSQNVITVSPAQDVAEALRIMKKSKIRRLPVVEGDTVVGIVTLRDVYRTIPEDINPAGEGAPPILRTGTQVRDIMQPDVKIADPREPLEDVALRMRRNRLSGMPVVHNGKLVGVITESDIFESFAHAMGADQGGVRISFDLDPDPKALFKIIQTMKAYGIQVSSLSKFQALPNSRETFTMRVHGTDVDKFIKSLWTAGYRVVGVLRDEDEDENGK